MSEPDEQEELTEPTVTEVPEPDQDEHDEAEEAAEAEAETEADQPPEAPEASVESIEQLEAKRKSLDRSATTWRNRVSVVLGEDAQLLVPCELCEPGIPGFHWPADVMQPADEIQQRLLDVLKTPSAPDYSAAEDTKLCRPCGGWGKVKTGSRVPGQETKACSACNGFGYVPPPGAAGRNGPVEQGTPVLVAAGDSPAMVEDADAWGSPRVLPDGQENPNYGRMPQYKNPALP